MRAALTLCARRSTSLDYRFALCTNREQRRRKTTMVFRDIHSSPELRKEMEEKLIRDPITFALKNGESVTVESVVQDTMPEGSEIGTVVAMHGSPGSHKDFKYITPLLHQKGIRMIGINFPHYGHTEGHPSLQFDNVERNNYVKSVIEKVGLKEKTIIMGHSRGCENATGTAALVTDLIVGLVLLNPTGLRLHRGLRPFWPVTLVLWLYDLGSMFRILVNNLMFYFYNNLIGLKLDSGERALTCVRTMSHIELEEMKPKIETLNKADNVQVLIAYSGKDLFIEPSISKELSASFHDHKEVECPDRSNEANDQAYQETSTLLSQGVKSVSVGFMEDNHFLQKHRAKFVADAVEVMLKRL